MVEPTRFESVAKCAYEVAMELIGTQGFQKLSAESLLRESPNEFVMRLMEFVNDRFNLEVIYANLPDAAAASWLYRVRRNHHLIVIDLKKITIWAEERGIPREAQLVRLILHEVGHFLLSDDFHSESLSKGSAHISGIESEEAWIFVFVFLGVVAGNYSRSRRLMSTFDDTPKLVI